MPISYSDAARIVETAQGKAAELGVKVTVVVVDEGAHIVALGRMDGAPPLTVKIAEAKAVGAAMFGRDGAALAQMAQDRPAFFSAADRLNPIPLVPGLGSALVRRGDAIVGAIGVSGARPEQDLECAEAALASLKS